MTSPRAFRWLISPEGAATIVPRPAASGTLPHEAAFHTRMALDPQLFCTDLAMTEPPSADGSSTTIRWTGVPYCNRHDARTASGTGLHTLGWNIIRTVDDGTRAIVTLRNRTLTNGGRWHVSAAEGAEPKDTRTRRRRHPGRRTARSPRVRRIARPPLDTAQLRDVSEAQALFRYDCSFGVLVHVAGELLDLTGEDVIAAHEQAQDAWEGTPFVVGLSPEELRTHARPNLCTPWSLQCLEAVADTRRHR